LFSWIKKNPQYTSCGGAGGAGGADGADCPKCVAGPPKWANQPITKVAQTFSPRYCTVRTQYNCKW